jgi:endoglucanase
MKKLFFILSFFVLTLSVKSQNVNSTYVNNLLGAGVNGYLIIVNNLCVWPDSYFTGLKAAGFSSVRIVWEENLYNYVNSEILTTLSDVVDKCISADLIPVLDYHYTQFYSYTAEKGELFVNNWAAIAYHFRTYPYDRLVFDLVNEPNSSSPAFMTASTWNTLADNAVEAIRNNDADRVIMVSPMFWGHIEGLSTFVLPNYDNLILSIHYYKPDWMVFQGCPYSGGMNGEATVGTHWRNIQPMIDNLEAEWQPVFDFQVANNNIPVNIGEYGTTIWADLDNRIKYFTLLTRWWESKGFSHMVWNYDFDFGIMQNPYIDPDNQRVFFPGITEAITSDELNLDTYTPTTILEDNFTSIGSWSTYMTGGGIVSISVSGGELVINASATDYISLNARVYTPTFNLYKDSIYRVTYTGHTTSGTRYLAHKYSGSHDWYDIYDLGTTPETFVETYIMPTATQYNTRLEFLVGSSTGIVHLNNFKLEKLTVSPYVPEIVSQDTLFFKDYTSGNNIDVVWSADCADSTVVRQLSGTGGTVTDTVAKVNFATNDGWWSVFGWTRFDNGVDSILISPNIYLRNSIVEMSYNSSGEFNTILPSKVSNSLWYLPTTDSDPREFHIRGVGLSTDYTYTLLVFSSRGAGVSTPRSTYLYVGAEGDTVESVGNTSTMLSVSGIVATGNNITFSLDRIDGQYGYINGLILLRSQTLINDTTQSWIYRSGVDFGTGMDSIRYAVDFNQGVGEKSFELRLDNSTGTIIDSFVVDAAGCGIRSADLSSEITGVHDVYFLLDTLDRYDWVKFYKKEAIAMSHMLSDTFYMDEADVYSGVNIMYSDSCMDSVAYGANSFSYATFNDVYWDIVPNRMSFKGTYNGVGYYFVFFVTGVAPDAGYYTIDEKTNCDVVTIPINGDGTRGTDFKFTIDGNRETQLSWVLFYYESEPQYGIKNDGINYSIINYKIK